MVPIAADLASLEVLRGFKRKMPQKNLTANLSPFDDRISTSETTDPDVPEIHAEVRGRIRTIIRDVRDEKKNSQIVLLAGEPGAGKTHLLKTFQSADSETNDGHIFVGGSNHWKIDEFQARLLDWCIEALTSPSPNDDHPLLERVRAIGFRAVEHLLNNPVTWKTCLSIPGGRYFGRVLHRWRRPSYEKLRTLAAARDPAVFSYFDFAAFGNYVCDRFLAERSNLMHRYALRVLLTYLFPDRPETGIGTRERVLHWFRGRADGDYFAKRFGAGEVPDQAYGQFEAVKLLSHLFSSAVSAQLATDAAPCPGRVLLLTFDQGEGRNDLFESDGDWKTFFAHLSELYNNLPNVVVLFTMTLGLRDRLHPTMERQFRDRILMDDSYVLRKPLPDQVRALYRNRIEQWLAWDVALLATYRTLDNPYLPLDEQRVGQIAGVNSVRNTLGEFDRAFHDAVSLVAVDPQIDFLYERNDLTLAEDKSTEWLYTADHIGTVEKLLGNYGPMICRHYRIDAPVFERANSDNVPTMRFTFHGDKGRITVTLARLGKNYNAQIESLLRSVLYDRNKAKNFIVLIRPQPLPASVVRSPYENQMSRGECPVEVESTFCALHRLALKREEYAARDQSEAFDGLVLGQIDTTWLGDLFRTARNKLDALPIPSGSKTEIVAAESLPEDS